jgi:uncharacterized protein (DUF3084 family)
MLKLSHYPVAIAQAVQKVVELDYQLANIRERMTTFEGEADIKVAANRELKNDAQRKAQRFELLQVNQEYQKAQDFYTQLNNEKSNAIARLEYLRNQFSVAKLEARLIIAQQLSGLESRELVGY